MRPFDKPALSVEQQLELLKQRGLQVANDVRAMRFLEVVTLFRLNPYMRPFQEQGPEHTFKPGSTLKAVVDIYRFDGSLRRITMDAIERVEVAMRATISNHMCPKYGPGWIADASVFSSSYSHDNLLRPPRDQLNKERLYIVLTMLAYLTDLISPDSQWKLRLAEIMDQQELGYLRLMGFPNDWKRQQQWCLA